MSPGCGTRRHVGVSASRRRRRSGGNNLARPPQGGVSFSAFGAAVLELCFGYSRIYFSGALIYSRGVLCGACRDGGAFAALPRWRLHLPVACAVTTHICGSPSSSLLLSSSLMFNVMHRPWRLHPRRRNRAQASLFKNIPTAARRSAPPCRRRRCAVGKNVRWKDKHKDAKINCPGLL